MDGKTSESLHKIVRTGPYTTGRPVYVLRLVCIWATKGRGFDKEDVHEQFGSHGLASTACVAELRGEAAVPLPCVGVLGRVLFFLVQHNGRAQHALPQLFFTAAEM